MVFSSYNFLLFFLPCLCIILYFAQRLNKIHLIILLIVSSLIFLGFWDWKLLWVLLFSIFINFAIASVILKLQEKYILKKTFLVIGIIFNLSLLGYFKYSNFFIDNINQFFNYNISSLNLILPLGISFYTFQQIAYLIDIHRKEVKKHNLIYYLLFVTFFPQLIAGPIVHHKEMMPQFLKGKAGYFKINLVACGITFFTIGLFKKVIMADSMSTYASPVFEAAGKGILVPFFEAWGGTFAYTFQIYFDFSGYSDMAIGLGLIFGLKLPINFFSPYKSSNLIEFWKSWHITLSRFLKYYLYFPLGGNKNGIFRKYINIFLVMVIGGFWHGANWTFVIWGFMHGVGIILCHLWNDFFNKGNIHNKRSKSSVKKWMGCFLTIIFINFTWVFFRSQNLESAMIVIDGMLGLNGIILPKTYLIYFEPFVNILSNYNIKFEESYLFFGKDQVLTLLIFLLIILLFPNSNEFINYQSSKNQINSNETKNLLKKINWKPTSFWAILLSLLTILCLIFMSRSGEFLYFQF